ncbi:hypothetical protein Daus18300_012012 [Diaporthe australafricana]|uniref:Clr5 domain-containing protein n=1 Tax=Diaporthe australafricana TaxID=127596 RepID=A0ABR3W4N2_9PEZI
MYKKRLKSWGFTKYIRTNANPKLGSISGRAASLILTSPDVFHTPEIILFAIQDYVKERNDNRKSQKAVDTQILLPVQPHGHTEHSICRETLNNVFSGCKSGLDVETFSRSASDFINSVETCRELLGHHQVEEAFSELRLLPRKVQSLLRNEPHHVLHGLFFAVIKMNWDGEDSDPENAVLRALLTYIAAFAADSSLAWPETFPLRRILVGFSRMGTNTDLAEVAIKCWKYYLNMSKPPGDENAGTSCIISSFSDPRDFHRTAREHEQPNQSQSQSAYERLRVGKFRTRLQHFHHQGLKRDNVPAKAKTAFKSQKHLALAYEATGLKACMDLYVDELVKEAVSTAQRAEDLGPVVLRMSRLEYMLTQWGDEENSRYARRNLALFGGAEYDIVLGAGEGSITG